MGDKSGDHQPREYTVADYLSKEKKWTPAKKEFRVSWPGAIVFLFYLDVPHFYSIS